MLPFDEYMLDGGKASGLEDADVVDDATAYFGGTASPVVPGEGKGFEILEMQHADALAMLMEDLLVIASPLQPATIELEENCLWVRLLEEDVEWSDAVGWAELCDVIVIGEAHAGLLDLFQ